MGNFYELAEHMKQLYDALQDEKSREIFWARLRYDMEPSEENVCRLIDLVDLCLDAILECARVHPGQKIILYGAGDHGRLVGSRILESGGDFWGYCDRKAEEGTTNLCVSGRNKPVISPDHLLELSQECYVSVATPIFCREIMEYLRKRDFPQSHILPSVHKEQYFEFPELFKKGTAFVDVGSWNAVDSIRFAEWCKGEYSKIIAFEPDSTNYRKCLHNIESTGLSNVEVIHGALGKYTGEQCLATGFGMESCLLEALASAEFLQIGPTPLEGDNSTVVETVNTYRLDDFAENITVGFIKMDIEGAELDALQGAEKTIQRDKPLLAICVYHRRGDVLTITNYIQNLVPEYRFWLRHYGPTRGETVLYAAI